MTGPVTGPIGRPGAPAIPLGGAAGPGEDARLRKVARQMQGVFVQELYKAMRATVPQGEGAVDGGAGEEMFTGLMDEHLASETPQAWGRGLGDAIYEHLRGRLSPAAGAAATTPPTPSSPNAPTPRPLHASQPALPLRETPTPTPLVPSSPVSSLDPSSDAGR